MRLKLIIGKISNTLGKNELDENMGKEYEKGHTNRKHISSCITYLGFVFKCCWL